MILSKIFNNKFMDHPERSSIPDNQGRGNKFDYAEKIVGDRLKEMREKVERAEAAQLDFIIRNAKPLTLDQRLLLKEAKAYIDGGFEKKFNQLGAVLLGDQGTKARGLQFDGKIGDVSCCSERRAEYNFITDPQRKQGEKPLVIATARRDESKEGLYQRHITESVGPCALCRDATSSLNDQADIIQPIGGEVKTVPVSLTYPSRKLLTAEGELSEVDRQYRELLLEISKNFPITSNDERIIKRAQRELGGELISGSNEEVMLAGATGFSGEVYINKTPKLTRNPQSLVIDKPVEFHLSCKATENHDQLLTSVILKGKREGSQQQTQKVMLPSGVGRELIRQFHPLATVVSDFGKDGLGKLPIEVLYPLVYKLRKRKNGKK